MLMLLAGRCLSLHDPALFQAMAALVGRGTVSKPLSGGVLARQPTGACVEDRAGAEQSSEPHRCTPSLSWLQRRVRG